MQNTVTNAYHQTVPDVQKPASTDQDYNRLMQQPAQIGVGFGNLQSYKKLGRKRGSFRRVGAGLMELPYAVDPLVAPAPTV